MRYMLIVKASPDSEAGKMPPMELIEAMGKFNEEMVQAGVLLAGEGLQASSKGAKVKFAPDQKPVAIVWSVRGNERADRGVLADPGEVERRSRRVGAPQPRPARSGSGERNRNPPCV